MANVIINDENLTNIAAAIRSKNGESTSYKPSEMAAAINSIPVGGGSGADEAIDALLEGTETAYYNDRVTQLTKYAFYNLRSITGADFPNVTTAGDEVFYNCTNLTYANFPKLTKITKNMFRGCTALTTLDLNEDMISIGDYGLYNTGLETLILRKTTGIITLYSSNGVMSTPIYRGTGYIYVPRALLSTYKQNSNWATYDDQFRAIEDYPEICGEVAQ